MFGSAINVEQLFSSTYYIPLIPENCFAINDIFNKHVDQVTRLKQEGNIDDILSEVSEILHLGYPIDKTFVLELIDQKTKIRISGLTEVLSWYRQNITYICDPERFRNFFTGGEIKTYNCQPGLIISLTTSNNIAAMIWIQSNPEDPYVTMIGITGSAPYMLARLIDPELPSIPAILIPAVIKKAKEMGKKRIYVRPIRIVGEILEHKYGFMRLKDLVLVNNVFGCGTDIRLGYKGAEDYYLDI